jgi:glycosyltransferase involved in cell wall biosynthesis
MKIHFFTRGGKEVASSRVRVFQIIPELSKFGIESELHLPPRFFGKLNRWKRRTKFIWYFLKKIPKIKSRDLIYLQKGGVFDKYFFGILLIYKILKRVRIIFDFDDAIFVNSRLRTFLFIKISNGVIVGNHYLQEYAQKYCKKVWLLPSSISFSAYAQYRTTYTLKTPLTLGWLGHGIAHYENLKILPPVFKQLIKENIPFKFILIGAKKDFRIHQLFEIKGLDKEIIDEINWEDSSNIAFHIQKFDIGLHPLQDTPWNKGRCAYKAIEYMGCGVPVIASRVGENNYLIKEGRNGFLVDSTEEWLSRIKQLLFDPELRKKIGQAGQQTAKEKYSYEINVPKLIQILQSLK